MPKQRKSRSSQRTTVPSTTAQSNGRANSADVVQTVKMTQYAQMSTETLRLLLSQRRLVQSGPRQQLIARLQANDSQDSTSPPTGPATMPDQQLASMIACIVEQKLATLNSASNSLSSSTSGVVQPSTQRSATFSGRYKPRTRSLSPTGPQWRTTTDSVLSEFLAVQLYLDTFTGVPKAILCKACSSSDHVTDSCPLSPRSTDSLGPKRGDLCFNFNKGVPCARTPCPYTHQCNKPGCTAAHPRKDHPDSSSSGPTQSKTSRSSHSPEAAIEYLSKLSPTTPIDLSQLALYLHDHPDSASVDAVLTGLSQGFKIGFQGPRVSKEYPNLISARQNPHIVSTNVLKELQLGHTAGPFVSPPFPNFQVYLIGVVPKKHSTEWRTIFHLSFPKHQTASVNSHISPTDYSLHYITIDTAISIIQNIGQGCFMSKLDIKSAFRNIPVHPSDWELLGMKWNGPYFFDTVLAFGLRSATYLFDQFSCMID